MKKRALIIILVICSIIALLFGCTTVYNSFVSSRFGDEYSGRYIKCKMPESIVVTDEIGQQKTLSNNDELYTTIINAFNNKRIKLETKRIYLYNPNICRIDIKTNSQKYNLVAAPALENDEFPNEVAFIVSDRTNELEGTLYLTVTVSKEEFYSMFPNWSFDN